MKNILKKNQVIIAALAIMICVAGYLNFTQDKIDTGKDKASKETLETSAKNGDNTDLTNSELDITDAEISDPSVLSEDASTVNDNNELSKSITTSPTASVAPTATAASTTQKDGKDGKDSKTTGSDSDKLTGSDSANNKDNVGEAVLANSSVSSEFFASAKMNREQTRAKNKETLNNIINNNKLTEKEKQNAADKMIELTSIADKETGTETLLQAKGFEQTVVTITDDSVDVVVNSNNLTEQQIAQIEDIVKRKTGISAKNIVISPAKVEETKK